MQARCSVRTCTVVTAFTAVVVSAAPAGAVTCADRVVQARGEPSRFETFAKAKARGNWRAQVRAIPSFGAEYSNWSIALDADYQCVEGQNQYTCTAAARPCRK